MNKEHFLIELKIYLKPLSTQQQKIFLDKYETIFEEQIEAGQSEEQIAKSLGKPKEIAEDILSEFDIEVQEKQLNRRDWQEVYPEDNSFNQEQYTEHPYGDYGQYQSKPNHSPFVRFLQISGLLMLNFFLMIWVIFSAVMGFFAFWLSAFIFTISPILAMLSSIPFLFNDGDFFKVFFSIFLCGIGIIGILILIPLTKVFWHLLVKYFRWNILVLRGEL